MLMNVKIGVGHGMEISVIDIQTLDIEDDGRRLRRGGGRRRAGGERAVYHDGTRLQANRHSISSQV